MYYLRVSLALLVLLAASCVKPAQPSDWSFNLGIQASFQSNGDDPQPTKSD